MLFKGCLKFKGCFKEVLRVFTENIKGFPRKFEGCFKEVSRGFKEVSGNIQRCFKKVSWVFQLRLKGFQVVLRVFQRYLKEV